MKLKLTPLNILSAGLITAIVYLFIFPDEYGWRKLGAISLGLMFACTVISDIIFRFFFKDLKRIWIVEVVFLIFAAVLIIILQKI
ncbi:MAG TPA: hypothetical protein VGE26_08865 [Sphingobacteriaceae bacterium]